MQRIKKLRVFAGPNGSGKSTLYNEIKHYFKTGFYINADEIESHLNLKRFIDLDKLGLKLTSNDLAVFSKTKEAKSLLKKSIESQHEIDIELIPIGIL